MAKYELVVEIVDDTLTFPVSEEQAVAIAVTGVTAIRETLSEETVCKLDVLDIELLAIRDHEFNTMVWTYNAVKFGHPINEVYCKASPVNDVFLDLINHHERYHTSERQVLNADKNETAPRVKSQLKQLIFDMYEHEHAVMPEVPEPPSKQDGLHDVNGTYVGDLVWNYNKSAPSNSLQDFLDAGWTREQLLKEKLFIVAPTAPTAPVVTKKKGELAIGKMLIDLKDGTLPVSVKKLIELLTEV